MQIIIISTYPLLTPIIHPFLSLISMTQVLHLITYLQLHQLLMMPLLLQKDGVPLTLLPVMTNLD